MQAATQAPLDDIIVAVEHLEDGHEKGSELANGLLALSNTLLEDPGSVLRELVQTAARLTGAASCGISLLDETEKHFKWVAIEGALSPYLNGTMPRDFSPCGVVLDRKQALMMREPVRHYPYIAGLNPPVHTVLLVPFSQNAQLIGTIWIVSHVEGESFHSGHLKAVSALAEFASSIFHAASQLTQLRRNEDKAEKLLAQSESARRLLEIGFHQAPGFVALLRGKEQEFELVNEAYMQVVGKRDLVGKRVFEAIPALRGQGFESLLDTVFETGRAHIGTDVKVDLADEHGAMVSRYVDFVYQPLFADDGSVVGIFVQGHDVTKQHRAISELQKENENKETFLSVLSHELRSPLSSIKMAEMVLKRTTGKDDPRQLRALQTLENQIAVMSRLVNDLVDAASIRSGKLHLQWAELALQDVFNMALETVQEPISARGQRLEIHAGEAPIHLRGDFIRLVQVVTNLLSNAAKYSPEGSLIQLDARATAAGKVVIEVRDEGIGIAKDFLPHIFDQYSQASKPAVHTHGGLGLGLSLVRQLVELHHGTITAQSEGMGRGSRFTVSLPVCPPEQDPQAASTEA